MGDNSFMMTPLEQSREIMTPDQAAAYLQVNRETIYRYIRQGKLVASKLGRSYRIPKTNLDRLLLTTSTRPDIRLRQYTDQQIEQFLTEDQLTDQSQEIADKFRQVMDNKPASNR
jgi:excisionase family DNA binding protein